MNDSEIEVIHFYNGPGRGGAYRVLHRPTGLFTESATGKEKSFNLVQRLKNELRTKWVQTCLLRTESGSPFRPASFDRRWLLWNDGTLIRMAQAMYHQSRFDGMPVLADALEEAGCHDLHILGHCRQATAHVRGCWVIGLILSKE